MTAVGFDGGGGGGVSAVCRDDEISPGWLAAGCDRTWMMMISVHNIFAHAIGLFGRRRCLFRGRGGGGVSVADAGPLHCANVAGRRRRPRKKAPTQNSDR